MSKALFATGVLDRRSALQCAKKGGVVWEETLLVPPGAVTPWDETLALSRLFKTPSAVIAAVEEAGGRAEVSVDPAG